MRKYVAGGVGIMLAFVLGFEREANATSKATAEAVAIGNIWTAMRFFEMKHDGRSPTNWAQVNEEISLDRINEQTLPKSPAYPLQQHYVFVTDKIPVPGTEMGDLVLIRTGPVKYGEGEEEREGRHIISRHDGILKYTWLAEDKVQNMLTDAGVKELPKPEPLAQSSNVSAPPQPEINPKVVVPTTKPETTASQLTTMEQSTKAPTIAPVEPSKTPSTTDVQTTPAPESSSLVKPLILVLVIFLGLAAAFVLLRSRK